MKTVYTLDELEELYKKANLALVKMNCIWDYYCIACENPQPESECTCLRDE